MLKFLAGNANGSLVGFGLAEENIQKLKEGKPIIVKFVDFIEHGDVPKDLTFLGTTVVIFYGKTDEDMEKELKEFFDKDTKIIDSRRSN